MYKTLEEFAAAREQYFKTHKGACEAREVDCLNLIMKREYAEQILAGTKKLEFRQYSPFYTSRLVDDKVSKFIEKHADENDTFVFMNDIRPVKKIHFYNYNKSWYLDVECEYNDVFSITKKDIEFLQKEYGCHDFDEDLAIYEKAGEEMRPWLFYFVCGKVLDTNLK